MNVNVRLCNKKNRLFIIKSIFIIYQKLELLSTSSLSFIKDLSPSLAEGSLLKHSHSHIYHGRLKFLKRCICENASVLNFKRWFCLKDTFLTYTNPFENNSLGYTMLVDHGFECSLRHKPAAYHSLRVKNLEQTLILKCASSAEKRHWYNKIMIMLGSPQAKLFHEPNLNKSFAPTRAAQNCKWFINTDSYMAHVYESLNSAKEEIFITAWWLCPELYMKRPALPHNLDRRLDKLLLRKSRENVKVYVLLYHKESSGEALASLSSERVRNVLTQNGRNRNIKVIEHPKSSCLYWSHHEKLVVVDQTVAFVGGVDLCFGRWDNELYSLVDLGKTQNVSEIDVSKHGLDSSLFIEITEFKDKKSFVNMAFDRAEDETMLPTMKELGLREDGGMFEERSKRERLKRKIYQIKKSVAYERTLSTISENVDSVFTIEYDEDLEEGDENAVAGSENPVLSSKVELKLVKSYVWIGKDYSNVYKRDFFNVDDYSKDQLDRTQVPRMPWRDMAMVVSGESARDAARHFIQRWNRHIVKRILDKI
jgi:phospholipase D1/2